MFSGLPAGFLKVNFDPYYYKSGSHEIPPLFFACRFGPHFRILF